jgi:hypothetical protein
VIRSLSAALLCLLALGPAAAAQPVERGGQPASNGDTASKAGPGAATDPAKKSDTVKPDETRKPDEAKKPGEAKKTGEPDQADDTAKTGEEKDAAAAPDTQERDDAVLDRAQPDFTVVNMPTTLRLPQWKSAFRVTHRFTRSLGQGDFGDLVEDFFGLDSGALIGLEFRFGLLPGTQIGVLRTNDRTIELFGQYDIVSQSDSFPLGLAAYATIDGTDNFTDSYTPSIGVIVSRTFGTSVAIYAQPTYVNNTNPSPSELVDENDTFLLGLGARVRVRPTVYVVAEYTPRLGGYEPGVHGASFGVEKRAGGHSFQINFSNTFGTTMGQVARGGLRNEDWYLGFNISRKFF